MNDERRIACGLHYYSIFLAFHFSVIPLVWPISDYGAQPGPMTLTQASLTRMWNKMPQTGERPESPLSSYLLRAVAGFALARLYSTPDLMSAFSAGSLSLLPS